MQQTEQRAIWLQWKTRKAKRLLKMCWKGRREEGSGIGSSCGEGGTSEESEIHKDGKSGRENQLKERKGVKQLNLFCLCGSVELFLLWKDSFTICLSSFHSSVLWLLEFWTFPSLLLLFFRWPLCYIVGLLHIRFSQDASLQGVLHQNGTELFLREPKVSLLQLWCN